MSCSPIDQAIIDGDEQTVALLWRNHQARELLENEDENVDGAEMLLAVVAPGEEWKRISEEKAQELVAAGEPFQTGKKRYCINCGKAYIVEQTNSKQKFCGAECRTSDRKNRQGEVCRNGHPRTPENTKVEKNGARRCQVCTREGARRREKKRYHKNPAKKLAYYYEHRERLLEMKRQKRLAARKPLTAKQWKWAQEYVCPGGHKRTRENTIVDKRGSRRCTECHSGHRARWLAERAA